MQRTPIHIYQLGTMLNEATILSVGDQSILSLISPQLYGVRCEGLGIVA